MRHLPHRCMFGVAASLLLSIAAAVATGVQGDTVVADFERGLPEGTLPVAANVDLRDESGQGGSKYLRIRIPGPADARGAVVLPIEGTPFSGREALTVRLRPVATTQPVAMRWLAIGDDDRVLFQRRFTLMPGEQWVQLREPLRSWRWGDGSTGDWQEVKRLGLRVEAGDIEFDVDDVHVAGELTGIRYGSELIRTAFENQPSLAVTEDGVLIATSAVPELKRSDLELLHQRISHARKFIRRQFGTAVRPTNPEIPITLLIFRSSANERAFFERLGREWRVGIAPPSTGGYTVQDVASSSYIAERGIHRPVYVHEAVHAIVARDLRLIAGSELHNTLQEAIANYVQIVMFPDSIPREALERGFRQGVGEDQMFSPLASMFDRRVKLDDYAQLATLVAYLVESDPARLIRIVQAQARGMTIAKAIVESGGTIEELQADWLRWGQQRFGQPPRDGELHFAVPPEIQPVVFRSM